MTESYEYAFGRIKALEVHLLDSTQMKRLSDAKSAEDALKLFHETVYGAQLPETPRISDVEKAILYELRKTYEIICTISPERDVTDLFELKYDIHNMKVLLKSEASGKSLSHLVIPLGREGAEKIQAALKGDVKAVPPKMYALLVRARSLYEETKDFQKVQLFLDREHARMLEEGFSTSEFLRKFFSHKMDLENIRNYFRAKNAGVDFEDVFLPGGEVTMAFFKEANAQPVEYFIEKTKNADFAGVVAEGLSSYEDTHSLSVYEALSEDFLMQYMKKAKFLPPSVECVVGYLYAKEREAALVRHVILSKMLGIRGRVGEVYE